MKYINIECERFSCASSSHDRETHHIELVVEVDEYNVIRQFTAKEVVAVSSIGDLLNEVGLALCLEHFCGESGMTMEDFKSIIARAQGESK